ncbi:hypothetical protein HF521_008055 [Silurus meridionalis]|uniref:Uncharacterized protein n=1 Tax=Silurus meridionalis TaxID=175797 RepID=A0A8T0AMZ3_SILME|nr:hypothetical protein HF521_008055 [Silurus meridionalis]
MGSLSEVAHELVGNGRSEAALFEEVARPSVAVQMPLEEYSNPGREERPLSLGLVYLEKRDFSASAPVRSSCFSGAPSFDVRVLPARLRSTFVFFRRAFVRRSCSSGTPSFDVRVLPARLRSTFVFFRHAFVRRVCSSAPSFDVRVFPARLRSTFVFFRRAFVRRSCSSGTPSFDVRVLPARLRSTFVFFRHAFVRRVCSSGTPSFDVCVLPRAFVQLILLIAAMPWDWSLGLTFPVIPRNPILVPAVMGVSTVLAFLAVKRRQSLLIEKQLREKIQQLIIEELEVLQKGNELNNTIEENLSVIEDEQNHCVKNLMAEQKVRRELEEKYQKQKENILHQKLTQEELKRREKESKLSEVEGRALQAEEKLNLLRQQIAVQEKKAHENWLKARASERTLIEEKRECANLRQKIVELSNKMSDQVRSLYRSGPHDAPPTPPQPRGGQDTPHAPPEQQSAPLDAPPPSGTQS